MTGAARESGALGVLHGPGLGRQLGHHEDDHDLEDRGDDHTRARRRRGAATTPTRVAATSVHSSSANSTTGRTRSMCCTRRSRVWRPRRFSSTRVRALTLEVRVMAVSDMARKLVDDDQHHDDDQQDDVGAAEVVAASTATSAAATRWVAHTGSAGPVIARQQLLLPGLHGFGLVRLVVVHAQQVEQAVHDEEGELVLVGAGVVRRVAVGHRRADDHVAEQGRRFFRLGRETRAGAARVRRAAALRRLLVDRERQDIGGSVLAEEPRVEIARSRSRRRRGATPRSRPARPRRRGRPRPA